MPSARLGPYPTEFPAELAQIVGIDGLCTAEQIALLDPGVTPRNLDAGLLVRPSSPAEVAAVLRCAARHGIGVVPQGGRTGLSGGAVSRPDEIILSLQRLATIGLIDAASRTAVVDAGVTLESLDTALRPHGLSAGIDLGARGSATIGGMVSTNAGGIDAFRYGTMRERVLGLEVALPSGELLDFLSRVRKDNSGLALRQLFIGGEGTLGVITRIALALVPAPAGRYAALAVIPRADDAVRLMRLVESHPGLTLAAAEVMSGNQVTLTAAALGIALPLTIAPADLALLLSVEATGDESADEGLQSALAEGSGQALLSDCLLPKNAAEERDLWRIREDWAVDRARPGGLWFDISVPVDGLAAYLAGLQARLCAHDPSLGLFVVGHLADGNLHVTVNAPVPITERYEEIAPLVYADLRTLGGSFSAEHGIGIEKRSSLAHWLDPAALALMRAIKALIDPAGIMNPGKVFTD